MSPVGGSRHYTGSGLGAIDLWRCVSCGKDNTGPLTQGCVHCGAGKPGYTPPPAPPEPPPPVAQGEAFASEFTIWVERHPEATIEQAFTAGYIEGVRAARQAQLAQQPQPTVDTSDAKTYRTVIAALALFRDQILAASPEEVTTGEWLTPDEATSVIAQLQGLLGNPREETYA